MERIGYKKIRGKSNINKKPQISESSGTASKLISAVSDDLLVEIFIRLPDFRSTIRCSTVCKRWFSLISQEQFICKFTRHHRLRQCPQILHKLLFNDHRTNAFSEIFHEISFEKPKINLDGEPAPAETDVLPWQAGIRASFQDLLVLRRSPRNYYVYNPLTKQLVALPKAPTNQDGKCALVFESNGSCNFETYMDAFCQFSRQAMVSDVVAYWLQPEDNVWATNTVVATDPFKGKDHPQRCRRISLPTGFDRGWRALGKYVRLGLFRGRLRMSQLTRARRSTFALKVWELIVNEDDESTSWILVHRVKMDMEIANIWDGCFVIGFHPENDDVIFLLRGFDICQCKIGSNKYKGIWEFTFWSLSEHLNVCTLVHSSLCPTQIPALPIPI